MRLDTFRRSSWSSSYCAFSVMLSVQQRFHRGYTGWGNTDAFPSPSLFFLSSISGFSPVFFFFAEITPPGGNPDDCRGIFVFSPESLYPGSLFKNLVSWSSHKYRSGVFPGLSVAGDHNIKNALPYRRAFKDSRDATKSTQKKDSATKPSVFFFFSSPKSIFTGEKPRAHAFRPKR